MVCSSVTAARPAMVVRLTVMPASPATRAASGAKPTNTPSQVTPNPAGAGPVAKQPKLVSSGSRLFAKRRGVTAAPGSGCSIQRATRHRATSFGFGDDGSLRLCWRASQAALT